MSRKTQNTIKLYMALQAIQSEDYAQELPAFVEKKFNDLIHHTRETIEIRKDMGIQ